MHGSTVPYMDVCLGWVTFRDFLRTPWICRVFTRPLPGGADPFIVHTVWTNDMFDTF